MNKKTILLLFLIGGFIGFLIDTAFRSLTELQLSHQGFFTAICGIPIPFLPIYGLGLVIIYLLQPLAVKKNLPIKILLYGTSLTALELIGGIFVKATLKTRLWDYSANFFNLLGHIDLFHTVVWILLAFLIHNFFLKHPPEKWLKKFSAFIH